VQASHRQSLAMLSTGTACRRRKRPTSASQIARELPKRARNPLGSRANNSHRNCTRANGVMTAIADWPHLPKQADVQHEIDDAP
jgi:hypothetical protein